MENTKTNVLLSDESAYLDKLHKIVNESIAAEKVIIQNL